MKYRQNNDAMFLFAEIDAIRKTIGDDTPNVLVNKDKLKRGF